MQAQATILSIDDNKIIHRFVDKALGSRFAIEHAFSGDEGIALAVDKRPAVILLDVEMPGKNGYEVCDHLKHKPETQNIPVVFLSSRADLRDRMHGYEVGGADYLVKPFVEDDLLAKVNVLIRSREQQQKLERQIDEAKKTAYAALSGSGELGLVMQFVEKSYSAPDHKTLSQQMFHVTNALGLSTTVVINTASGPEWFSSIGEISPLEASVMGLLREKSRFQDFGCRTQVNYPHISLLVKNMPLDDMERYGRIKDWLPALVSVADARIGALNTEKALISQTNQISIAMQNIRNALDQLSQSISENQKKGTGVLRGMFNELNQNLPRMGLEDDQEAYILDRIEKASQEAMNLVDAGNDIKEAFNRVLTDLEQLANKQHDLVTNGLRRTEPTPGAGDDGIMAVELF